MQPDLTGGAPESSDSVRSRRERQCISHSDHVYVQSVCHVFAHPPSQRAYKCLNEDNREVIVQTLWNSRFAAVKGLPGRTAQGIILNKHYNNALTWPDRHDCSPCFNDSTRPALRFHTAVLQDNLSRRPNRTTQRLRICTWTGEVPRVGCRPENRVFWDISWSASVPPGKSQPLLLNSQLSYNSTLHSASYCLTAS
jgi:hypothetical protein